MNHWNQSMQTILQLYLQEHSHGCYAMCLAKSRVQQPKITTINILLELVEGEGSKWLQVLRRQAQLNYGMVYELCLNSYWVYPVLISEMNANATLQQIMTIEDNTLTLMKSHQVNLEHRIYCFAELLKSAYLSNDRCFALLHAIFEQNINHHQHGSKQTYNPLKQTYNPLKQSHNPLNHNPLKSSDYLKEMKEMMKRLLNDSNSNLSETHQNVKIDETFYTVFDIYTLITKLFTLCSKLAIKTLTFVKFKNQFHEVISLLEQFHEEGLQFMLKWPVHQIHTQTPFIIQYYTSSIKLLIESTKTCVLGSKLGRNRVVLTQYMLSNHIFMQPPNNSQNDERNAEQQLRLEYGIIYKEYGEDIPSVLAQLLQEFSSSVNGFAKYFFHQINTQYATIVSQVDVGQLYMKMAILYETAHLRPDLVLEQIEPALELIFNQNQNHTHLNQHNFNHPLNQLNFNHPLNQCRKLRLLFFYCQYMKPSYLEQCISICINLLEQAPLNSFNFSEAVFILQQLLNIKKSVEMSDRLPSGKEVKMQAYSQDMIEKLLNVIRCVTSDEQFFGKMELQEKNMKILHILEIAVLKYEKKYQKSNKKLNSIISKLLLHQINHLWDQGKKHSPSVQSMITILKISTQFIDPEEYCDLELQLCDLLNLLQSPQKIEIDQELLEILVFLIKKATIITPPLCNVLLTLRNVVNYYSGNVSALNKTIVKLCVRSVVNSILFNWPQLVNYLVEMFCSYLSSFITVQYLGLYERQYQQSLFSMQLFLQSYHEYISVSDELMGNILQSINSLPNSHASEYKVQLFLMMNHTSPIKTYQFYQLSHTLNHTMRYTFKLIYIMYVDKLLNESYNDQLLNQFIYFHTTYISKLNHQSIKTTMLDNLPFVIAIKLEQFVMQALRELRNRKSIDNYTHSQLLHKITF